MEKGIVSFIITPRDCLGNVLLPVPITLSSAGLEVLVAEGRALMPKPHSTELETQASSWPQWASDALKQTG